MEENIKTNREAKRKNIKVTQFDETMVKQGKEITPEMELKNLKKVLGKVRSFLMEKGLFNECIEYINQNEA